MDLPIINLDVPKELRTLKLCLVSVYLLALFRKGEVPNFNF